MTMRQGANILVVDDTPENLRLLVRALSAEGFRVRAAPSGEQALRMVRAAPPDIVLLDIDMPGMNGFEVCDALQANPSFARIPVLFLSALQDANSKVQAFRRGGRDYVTKPFNIEEVLARVCTHLELRRLERALSQHNVELERRVAEQVRELSDAQVATIVALAKLSESRDDTTGTHVERIGVLSEVLATAAGCSAGLLAVINRAAILHDIGKVGIPDAVLLKPGRLTPEEFAVMKTHTEIGAATLEAVLATYPRNELVRLGAAVARSHHEKWNGTGYPDGLAGEAIPLAARLVAVVDVYDAIRSPRPYKPAQSHEVAARALDEGSGAHFDPALVAAFRLAEGRIDTLWSSLQAAG